MRAIAFALLAIGAEYSNQCSQGDDEGLRLVRLIVGIAGGLCAGVSLACAIMGL
jgi:hypothetical protein